MGYGKEAHPAAGPRLHGADRPQGRKDRAEGMCCKKRLKQILSGSGSDLDKSRGDAEECVDELALADYVDASRRVDWENCRNSRHARIQRNAANAATIRLLQGTRRSRRRSAARPD
jgi:hypothetical protein